MGKAFIVPNVSFANKNLGKLPEAEGIVTNGLVYRFVGEDATTEKWIDRVSGIEVTMSNVTKTSDGKGVIFNGTNSYGVKDTETIGTSAFTIEVVYKMSSNNSNMFLFCLAPSTSAYCGICYTFQQQQNYYIVSYAATASPMTSMVYGPTTTGVIRTHSITATPSKTQSSAKGINYVNKEIETYGSTNMNWLPNDTKLGIGWRPTASSSHQYFNGVIYEIRVYNRSLTVDEVLFNQTIDMINYNIE